MKKLTIVSIALLLLLAVFQSCNEPLTEETNNDLTLKSASAKKSYIVVLNDAALNNELVSVQGYENRKAVVKSASENLLKKAGITDSQVENTFGTALQGFVASLAPGQVKKLQEDLSVKYIEEEFVYTLVQPDVKISGKPGGGTPPTQSVPWGITRVNGGISGIGKVAWIVDSGIDLDHPDLTVDVARSKSFVTNDSSPDDYNGHGTHVAGTVAAKNNTIGVVGVAAGATVVSCRVLDRRGSGSFSWTVSALDYIAAIGKAGDAVNMSLGPSTRYTLQSVDDAVTRTAAKGILIAMAAGNSADDAEFYSPARTNGHGIYTISAMDSADKFAYFSNYGTPVDYCDPGVNIYSCYKGGAYATMSGTSMASPHFCGLLLLGAIRTNGYVIGDKDTDPDPIGVH